MVHQGLGGAATLALLFCFCLLVYCFLSILPLLSSFPLPLPPAPPGVHMHAPHPNPPSVTGPVSCQVSSLLALSMSQRSDKSEPGLGLSLPLATEVSFSPSIIHILFNLTRWKWPRSVHTGKQNFSQSACRERRGTSSYDPKFLQTRRLEQHETLPPLAAALWGTSVGHLTRRRSGRRAAAVLFLVLERRKC